MSLEGLNIVDDLVKHDCLAGDFAAAGYEVLQVLHPLANLLAAHPLSQAVAVGGLTPASTHMDIILLGELLGLLVVFLLWDFRTSGRLG